MQTGMDRQAGQNTAVSRRVVLSGLGASVALPWLESGKLLGVENDVVGPQRFGFLFLKRRIF